MHLAGLKGKALLYFSFFKIELEVAKPKAGRAGLLKALTALSRSSWKLQKSKSPKRGFNAPAVSHCDHIHTAALYLLRHSTLYTDALLYTYALLYTEL